MSIEHLSWALAVETRSPLHKLILVLAADACGSEGVIRVPEAATLCATEGAVRSAVVDLVQDGLLLAGGPLTLNAPIGHFVTRPEWSPSPTLRARIFERDGHACRACGATERLCLDHIYPRRKGGSDEDDNLQTLCAPCNISKGGKLPGEWKGRK